MLGILYGRIPSACIAYKLIPVFILSVHKKVTGWRIRNRTESSHFRPTPDTVALSQVTICSRRPRDRRAADIRLV